MLRLYLTDIKFLKLIYYCIRIILKIIFLFFFFKYYYKKLFIMHTLIIIPKFLGNYVFLSDFKIGELITLF